MSIVSTHASCLASFCLLAGLGEAQSMLYQVNAPPGSGGWFGWAVAPFQDIDGDLVPEILVTGPGPLEGGSAPGTVHVISGATGSELFVMSGSGGERLGHAVVAGDVDGDGILDVIAGGDRRNDGIPGIVHVYSGASLVAGGPPLLLYKLQGPLADDSFGNALAVLPDVDGDLCDDFVVGADEWDVLGAPTSETGTVRMFSGKTGALRWTRDGTAPQDKYGSALASINDLSGDGLPDVVVGAVYGATAAGRPGYVEVVDGVTGMPVLPRFEGNAAGATAAVATVHFGYSVADAGDADGDGKSDLLIGAPYDLDANGSKLGTAAVYSSVTQLPLCSWVGSDAISEFGSALASLGDLDCDGKPEVVIAARLADIPAGGTDAGRVGVYSTSSGCPLLGSFWGAAGDWLGQAVAAIGDVSGDGVGDFAAGAAMHATGGTTGQVTVYASPSGGGAFSVSSISPAEVDACAAQLGTIKGNCLDQVQTVRVDGVTVPILSQSPTQIMVQVPAAPPYRVSDGPVDVVLQLPGGEQTLNDAWTWLPSLRVSGDWLPGSMISTTVNGGASSSLFFLFAANGLFSSPGLAVPFSCTNLALVGPVLLAGPWPDGTSVTWSLPTTWSALPWLQALEFRLSPTPALLGITNADS